MSFAYGAPGDILFESGFNSNGALNSDWTTSGSVDLQTVYYSSPASAVYLRSGGELSFKRNLDTRVPAAALSIWVRRASDFIYLTGSGDDLRVQYRNNLGSWTTLAVFPGDGVRGEVFNFNMNLPADALHAGFLLRFVNVGSGFFTNPTWYVDDVRITEAAPPIPPASLVSYWQLDEFEWSGTGAEVLDAGGSNNHGTAFGGLITSEAAPVVAGNPGTCRYGEFDGIDDYIEVAGISSTLNATASLAFWIRTTQTGNDIAWQAPGVAGVELNGQADDIFWGWLDASGRIGISVGNDFSTKSTVVINNGVWRHVVLTRDHDAGTYKIYIDGALNASGSIDSGPVGTAYSSIGRIEDTSGTPQYFAGDLDEVRIYEGVLTDAEVSSIMGETHPCAIDFCPNGTPQPGLIGDYYNGINLSGGIAASRLDAVVNFDWGTGAPGPSGIASNQFSVQWNGFIRVTETGQYRFRTISDDGVRLRVDNQLLINRWNDHSATTDTSGMVSLTAGQAYPISLDFYENGGDAEIRLQWQTPSSGAYVPIPAGPATLGAGLYSCSSAQVGYYEISHSGTGLTCEAEPITISAFDANGNTYNPPSGTQISLSTSTVAGVWVDGNTHLFDGSTSSVVKYLQQTSPATLNINVTDGSVTESASADDNIIFSDIGLRFYGDTNASALSHQVAGVNDPNMVLRIVEADSDTGACVTRVQNTSRVVALAYECRNPASCSSGQNLSLAGTSIPANNSAAAITYGNVNLAFDGAGFAAIPFQFSDVGQIQLHGQITLPAEDEHPGITVSGSSSEFVVKPHSLAVIAAESVDGDPNPSSEASGTGFIPAGESFVVRVEARNALGNRTPAFGREATPEGLEVTIAQLTFPIGGNSGTLTNAQAFAPMGATPGVYENQSINWSEAGSIRLGPTLVDGDYLGAGAITSTNSAAIGRFFPAQLVLQSSAADNSCDLGGFSYLSEAAVEIGYEVEARNIFGVRTQNYDDTSFDPPFPTTVLSLHGENQNDGTDLEDRLSVVPGTWVNGRYVVLDNAAALMRLDNGGVITPDGPFTNVRLALRSSGGIDVLDFDDLDFNADAAGDCEADGTCDSKELNGNLNFRFGRMRLQDLHGPESAPIPMVWQTEYWNGNGFELNSNDHCTRLPISNVSFVGAATSVDDVNDAVSVDLGGAISTFDFSDPVGASDCLTGSDIAFCDGRAGRSYGPPGVTRTYPIAVDLTAFPYLRGDWNQDGSYDDAAHPTVYIRFENYRGHDRVIYWREVLE